jgi:hypothetical protein
VLPHIAEEKVFALKPIAERRAGSSPAWGATTLFAGARTGGKSPKKQLISGMAGRW